MSEKSKASWRHRLHEIIYEADTKVGKTFDIILLWVIILSIILVMLESVPSFDAKYHDQLDIAEWIITILFSLEYIARIVVVKKPTKYIFSFFGIVDLLSTIPKYLSLILGGSQFLVAVRALRLLRVFRILKLVRYIGEAAMLSKALKASKHKIFVFIFSVVILSVILGTIMYLVEGPENGFTSIPRSVYWTIVTLTTVGYGDIAPQTAQGQFIATLVMIMGYGIIAVPTGIVTSELTAISREEKMNTQMCPNCMEGNHVNNAIFCHNCGDRLNE
ncbi:ion transporter [Spongiivirga sp. MCCC 1A20706]|uniref:ion transporter n=1 Tax=Spongiivirga sp. MCCC 1A20706 TaxID=3160963 RepID=UPI00397725A9